MLLKIYTEVDYKAIYIWCLMYKLLKSIETRKVNQGKMQPIDFSTLRLSIHVSKSVYPLLAISVKQMSMRGLNKRTHAIEY